LYVVVDFESTGLAQPNKEIIEIAPNVLVFNCIQPSAPIPASAALVSRNYERNAERCTIVFRVCSFFTKITSVPVETIILVAYIGEKVDLRFLVIQTCKNTISHSICKAARYGISNSHHNGAEQVVVEVIFRSIGCRHFQLVLYNLSLKTTAEANGTTFKKVNSGTRKEN